MPELKTVRQSKITPDLIPHSEFHKGIWLLSAKRPSWYYFKRQKKRNRKVTNRNFIASVDPPLKKLVSILHKRKIGTTPSCAGHNMRDRNFEIIFPDLEKDAEEINAGGLEMKDVETGESFLYRDPTYHLPWTKEEFVNALSLYQHKGVLGIRTGHRRKLSDRLQAISVDGVRIIKEPGVVLIFTNEENQHEIEETWKQVTEAVVRCVDHSGQKKSIESHGIRHD
jgi:hypothetical protein